MGQPSYIVQPHKPCYFMNNMTQKEFGAQSGSYHMIYVIDPVLHTSTYTIV